MYDGGCKRKAKGAKKLVIDRELSLVIIKILCLVMKSY